MLIHTNTGSDFFLREKWLFLKKGEIFPVELLCQNLLSG